MTDFRYDNHHKLFSMTNSVHETRPAGHHGLCILQKNSQSKILNTNTMINSRRISEDFGHSAKGNFELKREVNLDGVSIVSKFPLYIETSCYISR